MTGDILDEQEIMMVAEFEFKPKILGFLCFW